MKLRALKRVDFLLGHILLFLIRPVAIALGVLLRRDHELRVERQLVVLKMLGGGSLIVAMPALLAIRRKLPNVKMTLVCTRGVRAYAELMHIFDDYLEIDTSSTGSLAASGLTALRRSWRADGIIDLEVHSKLSTVFCMLTAARNRVGFFMEQSRWQLGFGTHFVFLNVSSLIATGYNQIAALFSATVDPDATREWFRSRNQTAWAAPPLAHQRVIGVAPFCSELGTEREHSAAAWATLLRRDGVADATVLVIGDATRRNDAEALTRELAAQLPSCEIVNLAGRTSLAEVVGVLRRLDALHTIDSGINHLARLCTKKVISYWGPTDPGTRLLSFSGLEEVVHYRKVFCSPCVHYIDVAPCGGDNICMKQHLGGIDLAAYEQRGWRIDRDTPLV